MKLYLDEDCAQPLVAKLLRQARHDVLTPGEIGMMGKSDPVQFGVAVVQQRVLLTANHDDFEALHDLILLTGGHHPGVLAIRRDNDPSRDMSLRGIVRAIDKIVAAPFDLRDIFQVLNHWR